MKGILFCEFDPETVPDTKAELRAHMKGLKSTEPVKNEVEQYLDDPA